MTINPDLRIAAYRLPPIAFLLYFCLVTFDFFPRLRDTLQVRSSFDEAATKWLAVVVRRTDWAKPNGVEWWRESKEN